MVQITNLYEFTNQYKVSHSQIRNSFVIRTAKKFTMKKIIFISTTALVFILPLGQGFLFAQQEAMFTHYMYNTLAVNPGYAGTRDALTVTALHRSQWVNFPGAPVTQTLTMHSPVYNENIGVGLSILNDKIGPSHTTGVFADFAYHLQIDEQSKLSLGLKAGANIYTANLLQLQTVQQNDLAFSSDVQSKFLPNFGFGAYYYRQRFYAGLSIPKLIENNFQNNQNFGSTNLFWERRHYFIIAGTMIDLTPDWKINPSAFFKITKGAPVEADLSTQLIYNQRIIFGAMFRTGDAIGFLAGYNLSEQLHAGYSYDWSFTNRTGRYNGGSHEVILRYDFIYKNEAKIKSPRYF